MSGSAQRRIAAYLERLPGGINAFPNAEVKYSVPSVWLEGHDRSHVFEVVPPAVHPLLETGFPVTRWVSEVHATCIYLALRELYFPTDDAFVADALQRNLTLLRKPMYRILMRLVSPERAAKGTALAFSQMHRGVKIEVETRPDAWVVTLRHPPHLVPPLLGRCYATALRAALEVKGYQDVFAKPLALEPELTMVRVRFNRG